LYPFQWLTETSGTPLHTWRIIITKCLSSPLILVCLLKTKLQPLPSKVIPFLILVTVSITTFMRTSNWFPTNLLISGILFWWALNLKRVWLSFGHTGLDGISISLRFLPTSDPFHSFLHLAPRWIFFLWFLLSLSLLPYLLTLNSSNFSSLIFSSHPPTPSTPPTLSPNPFDQPSD